jgi:hypothetical protein
MALVHSLPQMCFVFVTLAIEANQLSQNIKKTLTFEAF